MNDGAWGDPDELWERMSAAERRIVLRLEFRSFVQPRLLPPRVMDVPTILAPVQRPREHRPRGRARARAPSGDSAEPPDEPPPDADPLTPPTGNTR